MRNLSAAGLLECVDKERRLHKWTYRATLKSHDAKLVKGGHLLRKLPDSIFKLMASEMACANAASIQEAA